MCHKKTTIALVFVLLMTLFASIGFAGEPMTFGSAAAAGRELSFAVSAAWHGHPEMDAQTNQWIAAMLDSMKISGMSFGTGLSGYSHYALSIDENLSFGLDTVMDEKGSYFISLSSIGPCAVLREDFERLFQNFGAYLEEALGFKYGYGLDIDYSGIYDALTQYSSISSGTAGLQSKWSEAEFESLADRLDLAPMGTAIDEWVQSIAAGKPYKGNVTSKLGIKAKSATAYQITKKKLLALIQELVPLLQKNEALWQFVIDIANSSLPSEEQIDLSDEDLAAIKSALRTVSEEAKSAIPGDMVACYIQCFDAEGLHNLDIIQFEIELSGREPFSIYIERVPSDALSLMSIGANGIRADLLLEAMLEQPSLLDGQFTARKGGRATLSIFEHGKPNVVIEMTGTTQRAESARETHFSVGMVENQTKTGLIFHAYERFSHDGPDIAEDCTLEISSLANSGDPILTLHIALQTGEATGMPFDPEGDGLQFVYPGQMSEAEFARWCSQDVETGLLQATLKILSTLPPKLFAEIMPASLRFP